MILQCVLQMICFFACVMGAFVKSEPKQSEARCWISDEQKKKLLY